MRRFKGFTLTELMIALAVLGILVAVVTPAVMKARPNKNKMMIKKTFYTIEHVVSELINDDVLYPDHYTDCHPYTAGSCRWGFDDKSEVNFEGVNYSGDTKFALLFRNMLNVKSNDGNYKFTTNDGVEWDLSSTQNAWATTATTIAGTGTGVVKVDVDNNGTSIACTNTVEDCDTYEVQIFANGKLRINPNHTKAIEWVDINTTVRD